MDNELICCLYERGMSMQKVANEMGCSLTKVYKILHNSHIKVRSVCKLTPEQRNEIAKKYNEGFSIRRLSVEYGVRQNNIRNLILARDVPMRNGTETKRFAYPVNENAFEELTEDAAYWIGMLMADGYLSKSNGSWYVALSLVETDKKHVESFKSFLGCHNHKICVHKNSASRNNLATLRIASQKLTDKLISYGVTPRKSLTAKAPPQLRLNRHFWRGVIDGDGSLTVCNKKYPVINLSGSQFICQQFVDYVKTIVPKCFAKVHPTKTIYGFATSGQYAIEIIKTLYSNCNVALDRKLKKARIFMQWKSKSSTYHNV